MATEDLWGDLTIEEPQDSPVRILRDQASLLGRKTREKILGTVASMPVGKRIKTTLAAEAPLLNHYRFDIVSVYHRANDYPALLQDDIGKKRMRCSSADELRARLRDILSSERTVEAIRGLIQAATGTDS